METEGIIKPVEPLPTNMWDFQEVLSCWTAHIPKFSIQVRQPLHSAGFSSEVCLLNKQREERWTIAHGLLFTHRCCWEYIFLFVWLCVALIFYSVSSTNKNFVRVCMSVWSEGGKTEIVFTDSHFVCLVPLHLCWLKLHRIYCGFSVKQLHIVGSMLPSLLL